MKIPERFRAYNFWVALSAAVVIFLNTISNAIGIEIDGKIVNDIIMTFCGILVAMGFVKPKTDTTAVDSKDETTSEETTAEKDADIAPEESKADGKDGTSVKAEKTSKTLKK